MPATIRALVPGLLCAVFSVLFLHTAWVKSPTWDEIGHIGLGGYLLKTGRWDVPASCSHPPLAFYLHSLPSFLYPLDWNRFRYRADKIRDIVFLRTADTRRGNALLLDQRYDGEHFFFWSRATSLLLAAPLFWALYCWSRDISGRAGALLSLFCTALSPNLLAHATLINTDFALAADDATFSLSEVNWGILPGALVSKVVADAVLPRHAMYYCCLGDPFDGHEAERIGMINFAVPGDQLEARVIDLAERLMAKSPRVLRATKQAVRNVRTMDFWQSYDYLAEKGQAIKVGDKEDSYNTGLRQFLDEKSYKPTFEPFKTGTLLEKK